PRDGAQRSVGGGTKGWCSEVGRGWNQGTILRAVSWGQGWTDNSWGPRAIGDHGAPVSLPKLKKAYEKGTRGISWAPY
ncbi:unnamed protein product, partial [Staurois parvus]